MKELMS